MAEFFNFEIIKEIIRNGFMDNFKEIFKMYNFNKLNFNFYLVKFNHFI
jgi:hypothetical protein